MRFRTQRAESGGDPGQLGIEVLGRFGNYYYVGGWITGGSGGSAERGYLFHGSSHVISAESSRVRMLEGAEPCLRFLDLFWVEDGFRLPVGPEHPFTAGFAASASAGLSSAVRVEHVDAGKGGSFLTAVTAVEDPRAWTDRLFFEILQQCGDEDREACAAAAVDRIGWASYHEGFLGRHLASGGAEGDRAHLAFLCDGVSCFPAERLPDDLRTRLVEGAASLALCRSDLRLARRMVKMLSGCDQELSCRLALRVVRELDPGREDLASILRWCLPQDSQWWVHHALMNEELGPEQVADSLNCAGTAAAAENRAELAAVCFESACLVAPEAQSPAWNAGWLHASRGNIGAAATCFRRITRHYTHRSLSTRWPHRGSLPWPAWSVPADAFVLPEGRTTWPRISVVTPSFNQGGYIEETILSILNQGYPNLQYIVIDGNSTDGTREVLERYRGRIDHLVIESDKGQTEAINKGLRLADGELVAWLNSDDMYAPGALHMAALRWMEGAEDVIAGFCSEHVDHRLRLINRPAADDGDFNPPRLARIFRHWLKGRFFYQPEVFFSARILREVGLLDETLYFSMDYDLWMRFAKAGASLAVVDWPFAFFRKHESQKTADLVECVEEQARVRQRHHPLVPDEERGHRIRRMLLAFARKRQPSVAVLTRRKSKIFSDAVQGELDRFGDSRFRFQLCDDDGDPRVARADMVILLAHVLEDPNTIERLRAADPRRPVVAWFWDNHHHLFENHETAEASDVVFPGHAVYGEYLRNDQSLYGGHVPLCITQWARQDAAGWFEKHGGASRRPDLYGGFVDYAFEPARTRFLRAVMDLMPGHALSLLSEDNLRSYFGRAEEDRFAEWCGYSASLILPLRNDLSQRVFDALLAGQIPLVPEEVRDLDLVIPRDLQESLPIVRFTMKDPASAVEAHRVATTRFAADGQEGVRRRHLHALENHMFSSRINRILVALEGLSRVSVSS